MNRPGMGPLDQVVPTGALSPSSPLARPLTPLACHLSSFSAPPLQMPDLFFAPGLVGIYQADLIIPGDAPQGTSYLFCTTSAANGVRTTAASLSTTSAR